MSPTLPIATAAKVPSTKTWLLLLSLLSGILVLSHQAQPAASAPARLASRPRPATQLLLLAHPTAVITSARAL